MWHGSRRELLQATVLSATATGLSTIGTAAQKETVPQTATKVLNPRGRVPLSFVIDDSTCLVNMGHFCTPQFGAAFPNREEYKRPWKTWPREIPDSFVREFGEWCVEHGVKGKYSIVPNPACVGYLDSELPGWSHRELQDSLKLVRDLMVPNWDIHPEMITHTRVIDIKTGRPIPEIGPATIENSFPQKKKSVDELAAYIAYALQILKNCDLPCEGITTPGGFGNIMKPELSLAVQQAVRDIYAPEIPHYFKYVHSGDKSTEPILQNVTGRGTRNVSLTVNVPAGTGDWFGGWQGVNKSEGHKYCNEDATAGRMVELIQKGQPAVMLCHWPGMYCNGMKQGFEDFKRVVLALRRRFHDQTTWMKMSEIARYWAAKGLTEIRADETGVVLDAPFASPFFTVQTPARSEAAPRIQRPNGQSTATQRVDRRSDLVAGTYLREKDNVVVCFNLERGQSRITT